MTVPLRPRATYRLQFNETFRFDDGRLIVPYLAALGVSHVYASPLLMARPGSTHGYDIVDHTRLNPEIGDQQDFDRFTDTLHRHDMGLILDFVPNHMGVGPDNPWWMDVLEWGRSSPFAAYFDIDWQPIEPTLTGKVLLPVLGDHYGAVLERGELTLAFSGEKGSFSINYFDTSFPVNAGSYVFLLQAAAGAGGTCEALAALATELKLALKGRAGGSKTEARRRRVADLKAELARLVASDDVTRTAVANAVLALNGTAGAAKTLDGLHALLEKQAYRLSFWRVAAHEMNYRRFFDINDLAGLRMENAELFRVSHALIARLIAAGCVQGLRLDHVDGLRNPAEYLERLQKLANPSWSRKARATSSGETPPLYLVVEKILAAHERLRDDWPVDGTSGYEFMTAVNGLFVDPAGERPLKRCYARFIDRGLTFNETRMSAKYLIMRETLGSELNVLANRFSRLAKQSRDTRDYSLTALRHALTDIIAQFPVYRTYVTAVRTTAEDRRDIDWAVARARKTASLADTSIYDFIKSVLTLDILHQSPRRHRRRDAIDAALKFQQYTGPVMAKAAEDTAFYRYVCLVSLNEVGGEADRFGMSPAAWHESNRRRQSEHPWSMLATATHDHKRGEDMRARLNVLSEVPSAWSRRVRRWAALNKRKRRPVGSDDGAPSPNDEYLIYQTIVGAWPYGLSGPDFDSLDAFRDRLLAYMQKAAREAKLVTSWASPDEEYEVALSQFITDILDPRLSRSFIEDVWGFVQAVAPAGAINGLGQTVLKLTSPGVPDLYQGSERWDLSLVDPDNRRPVDFACRREALSAPAGTEHAQALLASWRDGRVKQYLVRTLLALRRERPALFEKSRYEPLVATGQHADRVVAFARMTDDGDGVIVVVPRFVSPLLDPLGALLPAGWGDTKVPVPAPFKGRSVTDRLSGRQSIPASDWLAIEETLGDVPAAVLVT